MKVNPRWNGIQLLVNKRMELEPETCVQEVVFVVSYCLRWFHFSDTRWCKYRPSCCRIWFSVDVGVDHLYLMCKIDPAVNKTDLHLFERFAHAARMHTAIVCLSPRASERVCVEHLKKMIVWLNGMTTSTQCGKRN